MDVKVLKEAGYEEALAGIGLSYNITDMKRLEKIARTLAPKDGGHNKFIESMVVWLEIRAPRYWWQEYDTYRVATTKQSECYDEYTEVLTDNGWKFFKDLSYTDLVCTINLTNRQIEYQKPTGYVADRYVGKMIKLKSRSVDLVVTPNHNMIVKNRRGDDLRLIKAIDFTPSHAIPKQGIWEGKDTELFILPQLIYQCKTSKGVFNKTWEEVTISMDDWLCFMGVWLSEGHIYKNKGSYIVSVCQVEDSDFTKQIDDLFTRLPFKVYRYTEYREGKKSVVVWRICNKQLYEYLVSFAKAKNKNIPKELLQLSVRQLSILGDWLMAGDGCVTFDHYIYISTSSKLINSLQELWLKLGHSSRIRIHCEARDNFNTVYSIARHKTDYSYVIKEGISEVDYNGMIYCVETPNNTLLVRRNHNICWSGNSTMHTITKGELTQEHFELPISRHTLLYLNTLIREYSLYDGDTHAEKRDNLFRAIKNELPEGFLQNRIVCTNYKVLKNMVAQRKNHRLPEWQTYINVLKNELKFPTLLF